mmetsp:Transcript_78952/g.249522  ORF Transcript_78952/g.249522 Transcript_78952/m.249522 type:complete len:212 (+) Transcript_78952:82-717(+)
MPWVEALRADRDDVLVQAARFSDLALLLEQDRQVQLRMERGRVCGAELLHCPPRPSPREGHARAEGARLAQVSRCIRGNPLPLLARQGLQRLLAVRHHQARALGLRARHPGRHVHAHEGVPHALQPGHLGLLRAAQAGHGLEPRKTKTRELVPADLAFHMLALRPATALRAVPCQVPLEVEHHDDLSRLVREAHQRTPLLNHSHPQNCLLP